MQYVPSKLLRHHSWYNDVTALENVGSPSLRNFEIHLSDLEMS